MSITITVNNVSGNDKSTAEISEKELGKALLQFVVNSVGDEIGEKMINHFSKIAQRNIEGLFESKKVGEASVDFFDEKKVIEDIKCATGELINSISEETKNNVKINDESQDEKINEKAYESEDSKDVLFKAQSRENARKEFAMQKLKETAIIQVKLSDIKKNCSKLYSKLTKDGKYSVPRQLATVCKINLFFEDEISCSVVKPNGEEMKSEILYNSYDEIEDEILNEFLMLASI